MNRVQKEIFEYLKARPSEEVAGVSLLEKLNESQELSQVNFVTETEYLEDHGLITTKRQGGPDNFPIFLKISSYGRDYIPNEAKSTTIIKKVWPYVWKIVSGVLIIFLAWMLLSFCGVK